MGNEPNGKGSAAMEARRTKMRLGVQDLPTAGESRVRTEPRGGRRESPHAAACRAIEAARRDNDASDPMPSIAPVEGPPTCTACKRWKAPFGTNPTVTPVSVKDTPADGWCTELCYAYRWSPTPPPDWQIYQTKPKGTGTP